MCLRQAALNPTVRSSTITAIIDVGTGTGKDGLAGDSIPGALDAPACQAAELPPVPKRRLKPLQHYCFAISKAAEPGKDFYNNVLKQY